MQPKRIKRRQSNQRLLVLTSSGSLELCGGQSWAQLVLGTLYSVATSTRYPNRRRCTWSIVFLRNQTYALEADSARPIDYSVSDSRVVFQWLLQSGEFSKALLLGSLGHFWVRCTDFFFRGDWSWNLIMNKKREKKRFMKKVLEDWRQFVLCIYYDWVG